LGRSGLSSKELSRVEVMGRVKVGSLRLKEAAELPGLRFIYGRRSSPWVRTSRGPFRQDLTRPVENPTSGEEACPVTVAEHLLFRT